MCEFDLLRCCDDCFYDDPKELCTHPDADKTEFWDIPPKDCFKRKEE